VVIGKTTKDVPRSEALAHVAGTRALSIAFVRRSWRLIRWIQSIGYTLALDLTCRDMQNAAKKKVHATAEAACAVCVSSMIELTHERTRTYKGLPWTLSKGFDTFCPVSRFIEKDELPDLRNVELKLTVCIWL